MDAIIKSANNYNTPDSLTGYGIPDFYTAYHILNEITSVKEEKIEQATISIYPNPINDFFNISIIIPDDSEIVEIELFDYTARKILNSEPFILHQGEYDFKINTDNLKKTIYSIKVNFKNHFVIKKIVKY